MTTANDQAPPSTGFAPVSNEDVKFLGTGTIPATFYTDPQQFELERTNIFLRNWLHIGHASEVAGNGAYFVRPLEVGRTTALVVRQADGALRAFHNVCQHRGQTLVWGDKGAARAFRCPYHGWTYRLDGSLRAVPDAERFFDLDFDTCGLRPIAVEEFAGLVFVNLQQSPESSLREYLGPMVGRLEHLDFARRSSFAEYGYAVKANWKTAYDNFQEVYHLLWIHSRTIARSKDNPFGYGRGFEFDDPHRSMQLSTPDIDDTDLPTVAREVMAAYAASSRPQAAPASDDFYCVFPNLFVLPGEVTCFTQTVWPLSVDQTRSSVRVYFHGEPGSASEAFAREAIAAGVLDVHAEDVGVIRHNHEGLASGGIEAVHLQAQEALLRHFASMVQAALAGRGER